MRGVFFLLVLFFALSILRAEDHGSHVDPFIGTGGHGHTFPGATVPFGMVQLSPDTRVGGWDACSGYHYSDTSILGFSHTHLSGTGVADYGDILVTPTSGDLRLSPVSSRFTHEHESASPGYYAVLLEDDTIKAELTASRRVGVHRYTFSQSRSANIILDLEHGLGPDQVIESSIEFRGDQEICGFRRSTGWAKDQMLYFVARFSRPFDAFGIVANDTVGNRRRTASGKRLKAFVRFSTMSDPEVTVKVGLSGVSTDGARANILAEVPGWDFDEVRANAGAAWEHELGKIEIDGGTREQITEFYTALYHTMMAPNLFNDVDGKYRGMDRKIHTTDGSDLYTVFSLWDTFRAEHPLLTIIDQKRTLDFVRSLISKFQESRILPVWELASNETWCMIGYHAVPVIVDAYMKGIRDFKIDTAYAAMTHSALLDHFGLKSYREHGYISGDTESESVSKTLEYAYDDWCIAQLARELDKTDDYERFIRRAQYYRNVFDPSVGFMRAKINGSWVEPFDPTSVTFHYTEANAWQYSFFAPQDIDGLIGLMGGRERFVQKLDSLFYSGSNVTGREQSDISGLVGQYAQGNEPSHHDAYLYDYAGAPWKTQRILRRIMDSLFTAGPDGLCGNDDCGQMSAWYVMSAMGLYQVTPGMPLYSIGSPVFDQVTIHLENGRQFVIKAQNNSRDNRYIQSALLNGKPYDTCYVRHDDIMNGGEIEFKMDSKPNTLWAASSQPHSLPVSPIVTVPFIRAGGKSFSDSTRIELACNTPTSGIFYTLNGEVPTSNSPKYSGPIVLRRTTTVRAIAAGNGSTSEAITAEFVKRRMTGRIILKTQYSEQYTGGGDAALIDGLRGTSDFRLGAWQGYHQNDLDAIVDLGTVKDLSGVWLGCLQDNNSWIFFPTSVSISFSEDGESYGDSVRVVNGVSPREGAAAIKDFGDTLKHLRARYIRVHAVNIGTCPPWHKGAGEKAWLFVDEIVVHTN